MTESITNQSLPDFLPDIDALWRLAKEKRVKQFPQNNLRASSIGHPCDRNHYHSIKDWRERSMHDHVLQSIFDEGYLHEKDVMQQLVDMGFEVVEQQRAFQIDKPLITGHIDAIIRHKGHDFPVDVKSIASWAFDQINCIEDLLYSNKIHQRNYPAQLQLYLLMTGNEYGALVFKNKQTGELKTIWAMIDYDYAEQILKRAERVYKAIEMGKPPKRITEFSVCEKCPYSHLCLPEMKFGEGIIMMDDKELEQLLTTREASAATAKEYETVDKLIKKAVTAGGPGEKTCGDWLIRVKSYERVNKIALTWEEEKTNYYKTQITKISKPK